MVHYTRVHKGTDTRGGNVYSVHNFSSVLVYLALHVGCGVPTVYLQHANTSLEGSLKRCVVRCCGGAKAHIVHTHSFISHLDLIYVTVWLLQLVQNTLYFFIIESLRRIILDNNETSTSTYMYTYMYTLRKRLKNLFLKNILIHWNKYLFKYSENIISIAKRPKYFF